MKSKEEFEAFYKNELMKTIQPLESYRLKNLNILKQRVFIFLLLIPLSFAGIYFDNGFVVFVSILPSMIFLGLAYQTYHKMNSFLRDRFKNRVLKKAIRFYFDDFEYIAYQKIAKSVLVESQLFPNDIDDVFGEDFMRFKIGKVNMMFCETEVFRNKIELFDGVFIASSFNKYFKSETYIFTRKTKNFLQRIKKQLSSDLHNVNLDHVDFDRKFHTISGDQIEARYILTPSLIIHILDFSKKFKKNISLAFVKNRLYCVVPNFDDLFEMSFMKPIDFEVVSESIEPVLLYTGIVEDLNLNLRIWSKK